MIVRRGSLGCSGRDKKLTSTCPAPRMAQQEETRPWCVKDVKQRMLVSGDVGLEGKVLIAGSSDDHVNQSKQGRWSMMQMMEER